MAIGAFLSLLKSYVPHIPKDPRTLLKTPRKYVIRQLQNGGEYSHLGLENGIRQIMHERSFPDLDYLDLQFNTDGLLHFKSTSTSFWPILGMVKNIPIKSVFVIGVFLSKEKPANATEFFENFVNETLFLLQNGLVINGKQLAIKIHSFICDAPARAFVKGIKCHSGYSSCEKCIQTGDYVGKVIFRKQMRH